jgi:ATP-binding cassette subfamily B protein
MALFFSTQKTRKKNGSNRNIGAIQNESTSTLDGISTTFHVDLDEDRHFSVRLLEISKSTVQLSESNGVVILSVPIEDIRKATIETFVGVGTLKLALVDGRELEAAHFTPTMGGAITAASRLIEEYVAHGTPSDSLLQAAELRVCPKCGLPLPEDSKVCNACIDKRATLIRLANYGLPYGMKAAWMVFLSFVGTGLIIITPIFTTKVLTDQVLMPHRHPEWILWIVLGSIVLAGLGLWITILRGRTAAWLTVQMVFAMRGEIYKKLQDLSLSYYDKRQAGSIAARVTQDVNELRNFLTDGVQYFFVNSLTIIFILVIMLRYNWQLTLMSLIPLPLTIYLTRRLWRMLWKRFHRFFHLRSNLGGLINTVLSGMRVVKAFAQEENEEARFTRKSTALYESELVVERTTATVFPVLGVVAMSGTFIINYLGGYDVFRNYTNNPHLGMTLGTLQLFLVYLGMLMGPIQGMTRIADWVSRSTAAAERVFEVMDTDIEVADDPDAIRMPYIEGKVELRNVRFSYDKNRLVLEDVSLKVAPGEMIGLVGHSGAGKSTIINLLSRFYDVTEGSILVDDIDIRKISMSDLRHQVGVVLQEPYLFPGTVRDNIAYAKQGATIEEVVRAARAANAHDFIVRLPDGYDTWVGERGARLSGGERQRISIARAILHDPRILILDEATASVDTETEKQIQEAITRLVKGRTTFAIAHRLSTLRDANRLVVIEKGKIVEVGTHDELLSMEEGYYRKLVDMQQAVNKLRDEAQMIES